MNHEVQCIWLAREPDPEKIKTIPLFDEDLVLVAARDSKSVRKWQIETDELAKLPLLMLSQDTDIYWLLKSYLEVNRVTPDIIMDNLIGNVILGFLLQDVGVAFSLRFIVQESIDKGYEREIKVRGDIIHQIHLAGCTKNKACGKAYTFGAYFFG